MKVLVCGGRDYDRYLHVEYTLDELDAEHGITCIVTGGCAGADDFAEKWARSRGINTLRYPPDWDKHGLAAGPIRNQQILDDNPDIAFCLAFPGGKGTEDMKRRCWNARLKILMR